MWSTTTWCLNHSACQPPVSSCAAANSQEMCYFRGAERDKCTHSGQPGVGLALASEPRERIQSFQCHSREMHSAQELFLICAPCPYPNISLLVTELIFTLWWLSNHHKNQVGSEAKLHVSVFFWLISDKSVLISKKGEQYWIQSLVPGSLFFCYVVL